MTQEEIGIALDAQECDRVGRERFAATAKLPALCTCGAAFGMGEPVESRLTDFGPQVLQCRNCHYGRTPCPRPT